MGGPDSRRRVHHHDILFYLFPGIRVLRRKFQQLVFIAGDQGLGAHAGFQELVEQVRGRAFHIPELLKDALKPGQDFIQIAFVCHAAAEGVGQKAGKHVAGIGFGRVGGAHGDAAVKLGQADVRPGRPSFNRLGQFRHIHSIHAVGLRGDPAVNQRLRYGAAGIQDNGRVQDNFALHRVAVDLLIQLQRRLVGRKQEVPPCSVSGDHVYGTGFRIVDDQLVPVPQDVLYFLVFQQADFFAAHITVDFGNSLIVAYEHIGDSSYDNGR